MRLIDTTTLNFKEFLSNEAEYAIVSHRWADSAEDEVSYQDFLHHSHDSYKPDTYGWTKIYQACKLAREAKIRWLWIDT